MSLEFELTSYIEDLDHHAHQLILESEDARWLELETPPYPPCLATSTSSLRPPCAPALQSEAEEPNPVEAQDRVKRLEVLEMLSLTGSHASFLQDPRTSVERVRIIECLFRRLISRNKTLLVRAWRPGQFHVLRFFEDPGCCTLTNLVEVWENLQRTEVEDIKAAITDAHRAIAWEESGAGETEEGAAGQGIQLLGGWIYKTPLQRAMSASEWRHVYDLVSSSGWHF